MCNYHAWFYSEKSGYVIECRNCKKIQVCFGNLLLSFEEELFPRFRMYIQSAVEKTRCTKTEPARSIVVPTAAAGVNFILTRAELKGLHNMIDYADTEMKAAALMNLFDISEEN